MGSRGILSESGKSFMYKNTGRMAGIKVLEHNEKKRNLPLFSYTSEAYLLLDENGRPKQLRIMEKRRAKYDVDFDHQKHHKSDLEDDGYHVHLLIFDSDNNLVERVQKSCEMTPSAYKKWIDVIEKLASERREHDKNSV